LSKEGWAFEQLYATGTRSVRGIEAVLTGFTPTPAQAVVKLGKSQTNFFTIADLLKQRGYDTSFIYGGESHFDNMRSFFLGNGFTTIVEQKDFKNPVFEGSWGASDEDLMAKANETFAALHKEGKPLLQPGVQLQQPRSLRVPRQPHRPVRAAQADPQQRRQVRGLRRRRVLQEGQGIGLLEGHPVPGHRRSRQPGRGSQPGAHPPLPHPGVILGTA
jgi:phosphoglycerol transferase MdoB-like AlkP superfamily enzyme